MPPRKKKSPAAPQDFSKLDLDDQVNLINEVLEPEVYPALQMDGGGLEIMDIQGYEVLIQYYGACGNCSIGETATLPFIEQTLQSQIDPRIKVIMTNRQEDMTNPPPMMPMGR